MFFSGDHVFSILQRRKASKLKEKAHNYVKLVFSSGFVLLMIFSTRECLSSIQFRQGKKKSLLSAIFKNPQYISLS